MWVTDDAFGRMRSRYHLRCRGRIGVSCCKCHGQLLRLVATSTGSLCSTLSHLLSEYGNGDYYGTYLVEVHPRFSHGRSILGRSYHAYSGSSDIRWRKTSILLHPLKRNLGLCMIQRGPRLNGPPIMTMAVKGTIGTDKADNASCRLCLGPQTVIGIEP